MALMQAFKKLNLDSNTAENSESNMSVLDDSYNEGDKHRYILVAAIDFGTTFSGYAFSFTNKKETILMNKNWTDALAYESYKTPTQVLTGPGGGFIAFGYEAETQFNEIGTDSSKVIGGYHGYNLYRNFKMVLHEKGDPMQRKVTSTSDYVTDAVEIFSLALRYLSSHMLNIIHRSLKSRVHLCDVRWVLTVPAIWSDESKRFMREAAFKADMVSDVNSEQLVIALEPEAASIHCQSLDIDHFVDTEYLGDQEDVSFKTREKLLVVDIGGGTTDITGQQIQDHNSSQVMKEISAPSGGPWGGVQIDKKFIALLEEILGRSILSKLKRTEPAQWLGLLAHFERAKKVVRDESRGMSIPLPQVLEALYRRERGEGVEDAVKRYNKPSVRFNSGHLTIRNDKVKEMFNEVITQIVSHIKQKLAEPGLAGLDYILLVGGMGQNALLQQAFIEEFSDIATLLIPQDAQLAIVKGAVAYGHKPDQIRSRISKFTYGCDCMKPYVEGIHEPSRKENIDGRLMCDRLFEKFITCNDEVETGTTRSTVLHPTVQGQVIADVNIYATDKSDPMYTDEENVKHLAHILLESSDDTPLGKDIEVTVIFGGAELSIEARDVTKKQQFPIKTSVQFMGGV